MPEPNIAPTAAPSFLSIWWPIAAPKIGPLRPSGIGRRPTTSSTILPIEPNKPSKLNELSVSANTG